ncbi:MAG: metallophosphoesterase family protein [Candidatus Kariarchaeaceae archaeon]|jgi:DNA repair exonuclease SbcCD nuclease subunit
MRLLALADTHLGFKFGRTSIARKQSFENMFVSFQRVLDEAIKSKVDYVLHAGDIFNRSKPTKHVVSRTYGLIENLLNHDIGFIVTPGNHERSRLPETLLSHFYDKFHIITKLSTLKLNVINMIGFPFERKSPRSIFSRVSKIASSDPKSLFFVMCHQLFNGAWFGPHQFYFRGEDALDTGILPDNVKFSITGHIHRAQTVQSNNVVYTGSTGRTSFAEAIEPKGFLEIETSHDFHKISLKELVTPEMKVVEIDGYDGIKPSDIEDLLPNPNVHTLLRITGKLLTQQEKDQLLKYFTARDWPFLSIRPLWSNKMLQPLFNTFQRQFKFYPIDVNYR